MAAGRVRTAKRIALWSVGALLATILAFLILLIAGSVIPANRGWHPPEHGVTVYVTTNGVHTGIVMPMVGEGHDWRARLPASDVRDARYVGEYVLIGWGERDFFLNTPRWADVKLRYVAHAATGSDNVLMHVEHYRSVEPDMRPIRLTIAQYRALADSIDADFAPGKAIGGYWQNDAFYPAHGRYSTYRTCNEWTGAKLRAIGVRIGIWTPASWSVMRWF